MITNPYLDSGLSFTTEHDKRAVPAPSRSDAQPQYVHHVAPQPPPEISSPDPTQKGVKQRCVKFTVAAVISLLLLLMLAGILLGYYLSSPCARGLQCGDGRCVWESQWCDGVEDCPAGQDEDNCVRLLGSSSLLQFYSAPTSAWRAVCSHGWTDGQGRASCQLLGYSRGTYFKSDQQEADSDDGFLIVKSDFRPEASLLRQLVLSNTCPNNSAVTLRCTDCGNGVNSSGGPPAPLGAWPWHVSLRVAGSHRCGGAIISPYWIVTAAHCVARAPSPADWTVYAGIVDSLGTLFNPAYSVSRIIAHEDYNSLPRRNDIALLRLSKPVDTTVASSNIGPVCLPNVGLNISGHQEGWITRFGHTTNGDSGSPYLTETQVSLIDAAACNSSTAYDGRISQGMFCARETEAAGDLCHTDSGGPLVSLKDGVWWLIGDTIWGEHCAEKNKPGVYGNVTYFLDWVYHQMRKHQDDR